MVTNGSRACEVHVWIVRYLLYSCIYNLSLCTYRMSVYCPSLFHLILVEFMDALLQVSLCITYKINYFCSSRQSYFSNYSLLSSVVYHLVTAKFLSWKVCVIKNKKKLEKTSEELEPWVRSESLILAVNALTSVCKYSILFSLCFLWYFQG